MKLVLSSLCLLGLLHLHLHGACQAARVESSGDKPSWYSMFIFGDSFADNGNIPMTDPSEMSRQWYYPYGVSSHANATGRFSNYMVQSDYIAKLLGHSESPPPYRLTKRHCRGGGMNFAVGGAGVYEVRDGERVPTLRTQVDTFSRLLKHGRIAKWHLDASVALVALSGNDYARVGVAGADTSAFGDITAFIGNVTTEIAGNVQRLRELGVKKILVNNMYPLGCAPWQTRRNNYTACDEAANMAASLHNRYLKQKLAGNGMHEHVHILDLNAAFTNVVMAAPPADQDQKKKHKFSHLLTPCCEPFDPKGYCGQQGDSMEYLYYLCKEKKMARYFYWDDMHPTQAGWEAVMTQLQDPITRFIGISS